MSGRRVPKGWRVQLMLGSAQRNILEFQEDAGVFRPERCGTCLSLVFQHLSNGPERNSAGSHSAICSLLLYLLCMKVG